jgi:hypothetical protein
MVGWMTDAIAAMEGGRDDGALDRFDVFVSPNWHLPSLIHTGQSLFGK